MRDSTVTNWLLGIFGSIIVGGLLMLISKVDTISENVHKLETRLSVVETKVQGAK